MDIALAPTDWSKVVDPLMEDQTGNARYAMDNKLFVQFYTRPVLHNVKSDLAGRPIYIDVDHVRVITPGDKLNIIDRVASKDDKLRFAAQFAKYTAGRGDEVVGTRLDTVPWMPRSKVEEYKYFGVHTIEQLAEASDSVGQKFPSFYSDRDRAKKFLEATTGTDARVSDLEKQLADMRAQIEAQNQAKVVLATPVKVTAKA